MKKYSIIYADPAWQFSKGVYQETFPKRKQTRKERNVEDKYPTMTKQQIQELPIQKISNDDCALFLWVTDSHLKDGIELIEKWGFEYRTIVFIWKKITNKGNTCANVGAWTMKNCEICLLGIKGAMLKHKKANNIFQLIEAERTSHSIKPNEARKRIAELFGNDLTKIELFARKNYDGWDAFGNELEHSIDLLQF
jgi:N6-adenosine-specific RNA methylase IME4